MAHLAIYQGEPSLVSAVCINFRLWTLISILLNTEDCSWRKRVFLETSLIVPLKEKSSCRWWALLGSVTLVTYGFVPTLQPTADFGRIFAIYGGFFIVYSYGWGWALDKQKPDAGKSYRIISHITNVTHASSSLLSL